MPFVEIAGINTYYQVIDSGPPLLMFSPGGFNATLDAWRVQGAYARLRFLDHLSRNHTCITFDRRECGRSGGRVESIEWADYAKQGKGLLDHLGIREAYVMGGCMGVSCATTFATLYPDVTRALVLFWPVGGPRYRILTQERFACHLAYVADHGLEAVVDLVTEGKEKFPADPRVGPWSHLILADEVFKQDYARLSAETYKLIVNAMMRSLFSRDTAPGPEPEDLMRLVVPALIIPGRDRLHGTSASRYLEECLPASEYWDVPAESQSETLTAERVAKFLADHRSQFCGQ